MKRPRRNHSPAFKGKVAVAAEGVKNTPTGFDRTYVYRTPVRDSDGMVIFRDRQHGVRALEHRLYAWMKDRR